MSKHFTGSDNDYLSMISENMSLLLEIEQKREERFALFMELMCSIASDRMKNEIEKTAILAILEKMK